MNWRCYGGVRVLLKTNDAESVLLSTKQNAHTLHTCTIELVSSIVKWASSNFIQLFSVCVCKCVCHCRATAHSIKCLYRIQCNRQSSCPELCLCLKKMKLFTYCQKGCKFVHFCFGMYVISIKIP